MRLLQHRLEISQGPEVDSSLVIRVWEQVRHAQPRVICEFLIGPRIDEDDIELAEQVLNDAFESAVRRTLGVQDQLQF